MRRGCSPGWMGGQGRIGSRPTKRREGMKSAAGGGIPSTNPHSERTLSNRRGKDRSRRPRRGIMKLFKESGTPGNEGGGGSKATHAQHRGQGNRPLERSGGGRVPNQRLDSNRSVFTGVGGDRQGGGGKGAQTKRRGGGRARATARNGRAGWRGIRGTKASPRGGGTFLGRNGGARERGAILLVHTFVEGKEPRKVVFLWKRAIGNQRKKRGGHSRRIQAETGSNEGKATYSSTHPFLFKRQVSQGEGRQGSWLQGNIVERKGKTPKWRFGQWQARFFKISEALGGARAGNFTLGEEKTKHLCPVQNFPTL